MLLTHCLVGQPTFGAALQDTLAPARRPNLAPASAASRASAVTTALPTAGGEGGATGSNDGCGVWRPTRCRSQRPQAEAAKAKARTASTRGRAYRRAASPSCSPSRRKSLESRDATESRLSREAISRGDGKSSRTLRSLRRCLSHPSYSEARARGRCSSSKKCSCRRSSAKKKRNLERHGGHQTGAPSRPRPPPAPHTHGISIHTVPQRVKCVHPKTFDCEVMLRSSSSFPPPL